VCNREVSQKISIMMFGIVLMVTQGDLINLWKI